MIGVLLENPKFAKNVGGAIRATAAFEGKAMIWTGNRIITEKRLPREERFRNYKADVSFWQDEADPRKVLLAACRAYSLTPVAVEVMNNSESLVLFEHPENALYVFGPEDGSLSKSVLSACHRFVHIPSHYALNLAAAVNIVLYDRRAKRQLAGTEPMRSLEEMLA